ncbi:13388_t:CDS:2 [Ambispora gerdemannii]|uniref:13388_t:CDS:1 n=1 Tax=Ambispora gerdemannii TaxID=144530 RepID=A0A9N9FCU6_9GLOM|nr:13388_t:CDS:2 [Ambispora gerdemannii]
MSQSSDIMSKSNSIDDLSLNTTVTLNDGHKIPWLGLGVYQAEPGVTTEKAVSWALKAGYRHIDTAALYGNEEDVGKAIALSGIPRSEIFVTTKIWNSDQGYSTTLRAAEASLSRLQTGYIDLLLLHSPLPGKKNRRESYLALQELAANGKVKSIGVSNYGVHHLTEILDDPEINIKPAVNQIEVHPWLLRNDIVTFCRENDILVEAYSPLTKGLKLKESTLVKIAEKYHKSPAQILIRWSLQSKFVTLPKSVNHGRIIENASVYDFGIEDEDMETLNGLDDYFVTGK